MALVRAAQARPPAVDGDASVPDGPVQRTILIPEEGGAFLEADEWLPSAGVTPAAGIVLIHSVGNARDEWGPFPGTLAKAGYRALAIDLRGHGGSAPIEAGPDRLLEDAVLGPSDLEAALSWLRGAPGADPSRLAVIGASFGAELACLASGRGLVRTAVALSPQRDHVHLLANGTPVHMQSILFVATSGDPGAEPSSRRLFLETKLPKQVRVITRAAEHGEAILAAHPEAVDLVLDWLHRTL